MSAMTQSRLDEYDAGATYERFEGPPDGWEFVDDGPMIENALGKKRLMYCPRCGPRVLNARVKDMPSETTFAGDNGIVVEDIDHHLTRHSPEDFGLTPLMEEDNGL